MPFRNISKPTEDEILAAPPMKTGRAATEKRRVEKSEGKEMRHERERERAHIAQSTWHRVCPLYRGTRMIWKGRGSRVSTCHSTLPPTYQTVRMNNEAHQLVPAEFVGEHRVGGSHDDAYEAHHEVQHAHFGRRKAERAEVQRQVEHNAHAYAKQKTDFN